MGDAFYRAVRGAGSLVFRACSAPVVIGRERVPASGPCLLAATHESPYDVALLIRHSPRPLDFLSTTEVFSRPLVARLYGSLNAFPLDRSRPDSKTVRTVLARLRSGRAVAMFPEGAVRPPGKGVAHTGRMRSGIGRLARLAGAPVVPCVVIGSGVFGRAGSWLPGRRTRYGVIFGEPLPPTREPERLEAELVAAFGRLHAELEAAMEPARGRR